MDISRRSLFGLLLLPLAGPRPDPEIFTTSELESVVALAEKIQPTFAVLQDVVMFVHPNNAEDIRRRNNGVLPSWIIESSYLPEGLG